MNLMLRRIDLELEEEIQEKEEQVKLRLVWRLQAKGASSALHSPQSLTALPVYQTPIPQ